MFVCMWLGLCVCLCLCLHVGYAVRCNSNVVVCRSSRTSSSLFEFVFVRAEKYNYRISAVVQVRYTHTNTTKIQTDTGDSCQSRVSECERSQKVLRYGNNSLPCVVHSCICIGDCISSIMLGEANAFSHFLYTQNSFWASFSVVHPTPIGIHFDQLVCLFHTPISFSVSFALYYNPSNAATLTTRTLMYACVCVIVDGQFRVSMKFPLNATPILMETPNHNTPKIAAYQGSLLLLLLLLLRFLILIYSVSSGVYYTAL